MSVDFHDGENRQRSRMAMTYDYSTCKKSLDVPVWLGHQILKFNFASSGLRCLPLRRKLGIKITCGNWYRLLYGAALKSDVSSWEIIGSQVVKVREALV
ncbi:hypothetical protein TNCV_2232581 [Trichonephila clavipes]|nr:hypothetical protein TNCV_2232581 [Trichonephila clavipes]